MGKIAAVVLPAGREAALDAYAVRLGGLLCQTAAHRVEKMTVSGANASCLLLRVKPDPLNSASQPLTVDHHIGIACGYYLRDSAKQPMIAAPSSPDSAHRLIHDFAAGGERALAGGDGVYAYACWDSQRQTLAVGVDKLGMRPLFWMALPGGGYAVASEIKALVPLMDDLRINWAAWEEQLNFGFLFGSHTMLQGIYRLGPAECIRCRPHEHRITVGEDFLQNINVVDRPKSHFIEEQLETFDRAMQRLTGLLGPERQAMLTLSGGFDSRRIFANLVNNDIGFESYTVPMIGQEDGKEFELGIVRDLCRQFGVAGHAVFPATLRQRQQVGDVRDVASDFESDEHIFATILAMAIDGRGNMNFDGLAGDVIINGLFLNKTFFEADGDERFIASWPDKNLQRWLRLPDTAPPLQLRLRDELSKWGRDPNRFTYFYLLSRTRREISLAPFSIQANSFESLCPYLDRDLMTSALSFPPARKTRADLQRTLIGAMGRQFLDVPTSHDPGVDKDLRYLRQNNDVEQRVKMESFLSMRLTRAESRRLSRAQRMRFSAVRHWFRWMPRDFVKWELGKATRARTLIRFMRAIESGEAYAEKARSLHGVFGSRPDWISDIETRRTFTGGAKRRDTVA